MRLALVCHGATAATRARAFPGDEALLDGAGLRSKMSRFSPTAAVRASPARAARETAAALGVAATLEPALRELNYGRWTGQSIDHVATTDPEGLARWLQDPAAAPHGGEPLEAALARVAAWLDDIEDCKTLVAITHSSVVRAALLHVLQAPPASFWRLEAAPLSVTWLSRTRVWTVVSANITPSTSASGSLGADHECTAGEEWAPNVS